MSGPVARVFAIALIVVASVSIPFSASAEVEGTGGIEIGVTIAPLEECAVDCATPPEVDAGGLARTGLELTPAVLLGLGLVASGTVGIVLTRRRRAVDA